MTDFARFFAPRSAAVVGSTSPGKLGAVLVAKIQQGGYRGVLAAVNPKAEGAPGVPGYPALSAMPQPPDLAVIVSPGPTVAGVLEDCGRAGVSAAVVITSGFAETGNVQGEAELLAAARRCGVRFIGPNCAGIASAGHAFFPTLELQPPAGSIALISQSGALGGVVLGAAQQRQLGISKFISYGNGADLNQVDFLYYLAEDDETRVVALYIESVPDGRAFMEALAYCAQRKPVIAIKAGRSAAGQRAAASHTGALAGADAVYDAALRACGAIRVPGVEELLDLCQGFASLPPLSGKRVIIVTNSGGPGVLAADHAEQAGLELPEPSPAVQAALRRFLPAHCSLKNPLDLTVEADEEAYRRALEVALPEYDAALAINVGVSYLDNRALARGVAAAAQRTGKPVAASFVPQQIMATSEALLKESGVPCFASGERAASVLRWMLIDGERRGKAAAPAPAWLDPRPLPHAETILEPQAMDWLGAYGLPVPAYRLAANKEEAAAACETLGYPAVMKVVSPDIVHKSDAGGVIVSIQDAAAARRAFAGLRRAAQGKRFAGVVVYRMVQGAHEALLGLATDPQFGPVIAFGLGGVYTEIWREFALRVAPVSLQAAMEMILETRAARLLQGARGALPCDLPALAQVISSFSRLPVGALGVREIDLNPLFVSPAGIVIGDARLIRV
jgi:acetyltransferase